MMKPLLVVSAAALFAFALASASQDAAPAGQNPVKGTPESLSHAKKLYTMECAMCHGDNGNGKTDLATAMKLNLADLGDPGTLAAKSDGDIFALIRKGTDKMPSEAPDRAKDDAIWNLVLYVRSFANNRPAPAPAATAPDAAPAAPAPDAAPAPATPPTN